MIKKMFSAVFIIFLLMLGQYPQLCAQAPQSESSNPAPDFKLPDLNNKEVSLSDFKGKPVILLFWTTWCPYCQKELKQLNTMRDNFLKDGVELIAVNVSEPAAKVKKFFANRPFYYKVLLDPDTKAAEAYGVMGVPSYFFIDKEGRIVFDAHYFSEEKYREFISK